ncbi:MAG: STAS domain-containing protein [Bacteroidia bacterium]|nr:STAS domain-containing protein [Bacteroidia bacterium]
MIFNHKISQELDVTVVKLFGELIDKNQANDLNSDMDNLLLEKKLKYVFDLGELKYMNSSGLNTLINLLSRARKEGGEVIIANVSKKVNELLVITKLNTLFTVCESVEKAIPKLK